MDLIELDEDQLRELVNAKAAWRAYGTARKEAQQVRGSMLWREVGGRSYLIRTSPAGAQTSLGPRNEQTVAMFDSFHSRKQAAESRVKGLRERVDKQRRINRALRVGRTPAVVVRVLAALEAAGMEDHFLVIGTHALYAYETAAGVLVDSRATATRDLDLLFDARKRLAFASTLDKSQLRSLVQVLRKADPSFRVMRDQLQTAVNDDGFEVDVIRRKATADDPHPMRMSESEEDFWAVQIPDGDRMWSSRRFQHLVVALTGEMATMRTLHPLDFIGVKQRLAVQEGRDPLKARKDRLQAEVVQKLWDAYLSVVEP